jgi:pyridoxal phosphate enzyme (YggS family)
METVVVNLRQIQENIARASLAAGRGASEVRLVCVSKNFDGDAILPTLVSGQRIFGENRIQEAQAKWPKLQEQFPDIELHLIGPLQSNKAEDAVALFDVIQTIDRPKIAAAIAAAIKKRQRHPRLFIQVNTGEEPQKAGVTPQELDALLQYCRDELGLEIEGLMCIPPVDQQASPHFAMMRKLANHHGLKSLSMGMSADFELAIQLGATYVRVGSAIFGERGRMADGPINN